MRKLFRAAFYRTENKKTDSNRISDRMYCFPHSSSSTVTSRRI